MTKSARIQECVIHYLSDGRVRSNGEIKAFLAESDVGAYTEGQFAGSLTTLLRRGSIKKMNRGKYKIRRGEEEPAMRTCFVVSPIGDVGSEVRDKANKLFNHIVKPVCDACGFEAIRIDQLNDANSITQTIIERLETADLVIADVSGHNPNVFYEIGFRTRTNRPIIHLKEKGELLPFDITTIRAYDYDLTDLDDVVQTKDRLKRTIQSLSFPPPDDGEQDGEEARHEDRASLLPILYQIMDAISALQGEVRANNSEMLQTVIRTMQSGQPQMLPETALQAQLLGALVQNPDSLAKLAGLAERHPSTDDENDPAKP